MKAEQIDPKQPKPLLELLLSLLWLLSSVPARIAVQWTKSFRFVRILESCECVFCIEPKFGGGNSIYLFSIYGAPGPWLVWVGRFWKSDGDRFLPMTGIRAAARTQPNLQIN